MKRDDDSERLSGPAQLLRLLRAHEEAAAAIRLTLRLLHGQAATVKRARAQRVIDQAIQIDAARRTNGRPRDQRRMTVHDKRVKSAAFLRKFSATEPRPMRSRNLGSLVRRGYLKKTADGYVRTAKEYSIAQPAKTR
jgi:hypothetical protein